MASIFVLPDEGIDGDVLVGNVVVIKGNIVVEAASVALDEKLLHFVMIHSKNSLCK